MFVSFSGGGRRPDSIFIPILYMVFGIPLILYPGMTGRLFCLALSIGAFVYAFAQLLRYFRAKRRGWTYISDKLLGILFLIIGLFCLFGWRIILSFLPVMLGILLLIDALARLPMTIDAFQLGLPGRVPVLVSTLLPLILGIIMLMDPFGVTSMLIRFFGIGLIADGACALVAALYARRDSHSDDPWNGSRYR